MNPLDMVIVVEIADPKRMTLCACFDPVSLNWPWRETQKFIEDYKWQLWHLFDYRGRTLREAASVAETTYQLEGFMQSVNELFTIGVIVEKNGRIVLRRAIPCPLEQLAQCAE